MGNILLAKPQLPPDWIDCSVGEAHLVQDNLFSLFDLTNYQVRQVPHLYEYPPPSGYLPLVRLLEDKYQAPVIITNGAKQALGACFYALRQMKLQVVGMRKPYWALIPPLLEMHGLEFDEDDYDSYLSVAPNNPDGFMPTSWDIGYGVPYLHDAAYYTHIYLPRAHPLPVLGDVQIYSASKMFGLSGLRIGWVVCSNPDFYQLIQYYMENMTVGVSNVSQVFLFDLLSRMENQSVLTQEFEEKSFSDLVESKKIAWQIDPQVLEIPINCQHIPGMFLWAKVGPKANFQKAKVNVISGDAFGMPGYVRMNLAFNKATMWQIVQRLNQNKE
jgi:aspartate/methionine/tyrosine aminotransferase